jgi:hypothetical protein
MEYKVKQPQFKTIKSKAPASPQPTAVESFEHATKEEIEGTVSLFKQRSKDESNLKEKNTSTEFWFAVYFADEEQRNEFLEKAGLLKKMEDQYINGEDFAKAMGIELTKKKIDTPKAFRKNKGFDKLLM